MKGHKECVGSGGGGLMSTASAKVLNTLSVVAPIQKTLTNTNLHAMYPTTQAYQLNYKNRNAISSDYH